MMNYIVNDQSLDAVVFIPFANKIWPGITISTKTQTALSKTQNITAYDGKTLVGVLRILTDGYFFWNHYRTSPPGVPKQGIGSRLLQFAKDNTPTMLYFGAQPGLETFYEKNGCQKSLQSYMIE